MLYFTSLLITTKILKNWVRTDVFHSNSVFGSIKAKKTKVLLLLTASFTIIFAVIVI